MTPPRRAVFFCVSTAGRVSTSPLFVIENIQAEAMLTSSLNRAKYQAGVLRHANDNQHHQQQQFITPCLELTEGRLQTVLKLNTRLITAERKSAKCLLDVSPRIRPAMCPAMPAMRPAHSPQPNTARALEHIQRHISHITQPSQPIRAGIQF